MKQFSDTERQGILAAAHAAADRARAETLRYFRSFELAADDKGSAGFDPVTEGDRAAEKAIREVLADLRPQDAIRGEEFPDTSGSSGLTWVLDPIDGTRAYLSGTPTWGTLIALRDDERTLYGMIEQPHIGERFEGGLGVASWSGPRGSGPLRTRAPRPLSEAILFTTFPEVGSAEEGRAFAHLAQSARLTRYGLDCYAYALLAGGHIDLVVEAGLQDYDIQAPIGVIEAAGGVVTRWDGGPAGDGGRIIAAANPSVHAAAMARLAEITG